MSLYVTWFSGGTDVLSGFDDIIYKEIAPACFMAPMKPTFDLADGQTVLVSNIYCLVFFLLCRST